MNSPTVLTVSTNDCCSVYLYSLSVIVVVAMKCFISQLNASESDSAHINHFTIFKNFASDFLHDEYLEDK